MKIPNHLHPDLVKIWLRGYISGMSDSSNLTIGQIEERIEQIRKTMDLK